MTLSGLHHLLCHSRRLACGRQILSKTRARELRSKLLVSRKHGFPERWFPLGAHSCGNTCYRLPSWENCVRQIRATVLAEFRWCADVTTDALLGQSINTRAHARTHRLFTTAPKATEIVQRDTLGAVTYGRLGKFLKRNRDRIINRGGLKE